MIGVRVRARAVTGEGAGPMTRGRGVSLVFLIYLAIGVVVALNTGYNTITNVSEFISFLLAVLIWPAVLLGADLHINFGG